ncbi:MAG: hypothetical protein Q3979_04085 [Actinomycetaceae bacterium]|nr:hypothetical protein [Actinomycetaceae bacterium]
MVAVIVAIMDTGVRIATGIVMVAGIAMGAVGTPTVAAATATRGDTATITTGAIAMTASVVAMTGLLVAARGVGVTARASVVRTGVHVDATIVTSGRMVAVIVAIMDTGVRIATGIVMVAGMAVMVIAGIAMGAVGTPTVAAATATSASTAAAKGDGTTAIGVVRIALTTATASVAGATGAKGRTKVVGTALTGVRIATGIVMVAGGRRATMIGVGTIGAQTAGRIVALSAITDRAAGAIREAIGTGGSSVGTVTTGPVATAARSATIRPSGRATPRCPSRCRRGI